jgi:DNA-binding SARP family transcriptional activator
MLRGLATSPASIEVRRPAAGWTPFSLAHGLVDGFAGHIGAAPAADLPPYPTADTPDRRDQIAALATSVCLAASTLTADTVAVLDDVEVVDDDPLLLFLEGLIRGLPPQFHLVMACRTPPNLRIARLRATGEVARVGAEELAITIDDLDSFDLDATARAGVLDIISATGGWPLAVHLAIEASRRGRPLDRGELIEHLLAPDAVLFDYLAEDVLAELSDPERELLMLAACVPELSANLLVAIGRPDLGTQLARLTAQRIFVEPVLGRAEHIRTTVIGGAFLRRVLPQPADETISAMVDALLARREAENALGLAVLVGDPERARRVLLAIDDLERFGTDEALTLAERAGAHPRLTELRGDLAWQRGEWDDALRWFEESARLEGKLRTAPTRKRAGLLYLRGRLDDADELCASVVLDGSDPAEEARVLAWRAVIRWARGDAEGCAGFVEPALDLARRCADDGALAAAYTTRGMLAALEGDIAANARYYQIALGHAERAGDVWQIVRIRTNRGSHLCEQGHYASAVAELDRAITTAELAGSDTFSGLAYTNRGEARVALGQLDLALADLHRARDIFTRLSSDWILYPLNNLGYAQLLRGQRSEAVALFGEAVRIAERERDTQGMVPAYIGLAAALDRDDPAGAMDAARKAIEANHALWMPRAYAAAGSIALHSGDRSSAAEWAAKATTLARARHDRPALAEALLLSARLEDPPSASLADQARRLWQDLGNPIGAARTDLMLARTRTGRTREELISGAERVLQEAGAWGPLADARVELGEGATSPVVITTLGGFRVLRDSEPVDVGAWGSRKARDLVKLLVARRGAPVVREEVSDLLWPDEPDRSARRLSVLLSTVRTVFDPRKLEAPDHYVAADHDTVWLVRDHVDIDVERFLAEAAEGRRLRSSGAPDKARALLSAAAARYLGEFCADDPYADWAAGLRELAKHTFVDTCFELARLADQEREFSEAIRYWLRILDVDAYDEDAHLGLINSLLAQRRHGEARRAYRQYTEKMTELELEPAPFPA